MKTAVITALSALVALAACSSSPGGGRVPAQHRASASACPRDRPAGSGGGGARCSSDADCQDASQGQNGRCVFGVGRLGAVCTYDTCFDDSTCGGQVCSCRAHEDTASASVNHCLSAGDCRLDSDCGAGGYCSPSLGACGHYLGVVAYRCHTAQDTCTDDSDCQSEAGSGYCAYSTESGHWQCSLSECVS